MIDEPIPRCTATVGEVQCKRELGHIGWHEALDCWYKDREFGWGWDDKGHGVMCGAL